jgi:putative addiction module component (TIGR02574 family)
MTHEGTELLKKALALPVDERAELAGSLIESLDESEDVSVQEAWDKEIVRRMQDLRTGNVQGVSLEAGRRLASLIE